MVKDERAELDAIYMSVGFLLLVVGMVAVQGTWVGYGLLAAGVGVLLYNVVRPRQKE